MPDWRAVREEFPALAQWTFLNTASFGQLPRRAVDAVARHFARRDALACADFIQWFDDADRIRESLGRLVGCSGDDIAFFPTASAALSLFAGAIEWRPGDRVLTLEHEFPNQLYWGAHLAARGVAFDQAPLERFEQSLDAQTRLVLVSTVNYTTGLRAPIEEMAKACRLTGTLLFVDGTQSAGALVFDCRKIEPDMFAVDGYKWLISPNGAGFAFIHPRVRAWLKPAVIGWRSDRRWREVDALHRGAPELPHSAERYEGGMLPFPVLYGMGASVELMLELGAEQIEQRVLQLASLARSCLRRLGARLLDDDAPARQSPIVAARWDNVDASALARRLQQERVQVAARHGYLRISTHFYNNEEDIERLGDALRSLLR